MWESCLRVWRAGSAPELQGTQQGVGVREVWCTWQGWREPLRSTRAPAQRGSAGAQCFWQSRGGPDS